MILLDTSAWIQVFRRRNPLDLESVAPLDEIVTCLPVIQEVLQGFADERAYRLARESFFALPNAESPVGAAVFVEAAGLYRICRRAGYSVRSSTDCLIAAIALRHDLEVVHDDRDYDYLARISPLRQRRVGD